MRRVGLLLLLLWPLAARAQDATPRPEALLAAMTLEQKAGQVFLVSVYGPTLNAPGRAMLEDVQPGGVVLFRSNDGPPEQVAALVNTMQQAVLSVGAPPLILATDQEGGMINTLEDAAFTQFPVPTLVTATADPTMAYRVGQAMATELRAVGITMNLAPVADLETNPRNPVMFRRMPGTTADVVRVTLPAVVRGMQEGGVIATLKHFPGHGDTSLDSHTALPTLPHDRARLDAVELAPFRATIAQGGVAAVMVGHLDVPALDPDGPRPASVSPPIVTGLLRQAWGYDGLVVTDALDMHPIRNVYGISEGSVLALLAGVDVLAVGPHMPPSTVTAAHDAVVSAVRAGRLPEARLDEAVLRVLRAKAQYGLLDWQPLDLAQVRANIRQADHAALLDELFLAGVTLARDAHGWVPLSAARGARVGLVYPGTRHQIAQACQAVRPDVAVMSVNLSPTPDQIAMAVRLAAQVDVMVVFTENAVTVPEQAALVRALPPQKTLVVATFSPYDITAFPDVAAYMTTYSPARPAVPAACAIVFGAAPARAVLPLTLMDALPAGSHVHTPER